MAFYTPAEDSFFLADIVKDYLSKLSPREKNNLIVLDLGTGSGIQSENCINAGIKRKNIIAADINASALNKAKKLKVNSIKSDLFENLSNKFDLIIFNPPYLPEHEFDSQPDTAGGKKGDETIAKFISQLKNHLSEGGICFMLTSSFTPENLWKNTARKNKLKIKKTAEKALFQEKLFVWKIF